jgi:hypothetical protein
MSQRTKAASQISCGFSTAVKNVLFAPNTDVTGASVTGLKPEALRLEKKHNRRCPLHATAAASSRQYQLVRILRQLTPVALV